MMVAVVFKSVEMSPNLLSVIFGVVFIVFGVVWGVLCIRNLVKFLRGGKSNQELLRLKREWWENGTAISQWLKDHIQELNSNMETTISDFEFQELLRRDFELYNKLIIIDPELKGDSIANEGRTFYWSFIRTEGQRPS